MAKNVLDDLLFEQRKILAEYEQAHLAARAQLERIDADRQKQLGVVQGIEMAIGRLAEQPARG